MLDKLLAAFPGLHATAPPDLLRSVFVHGVKKLPCAADGCVTPAGRTKY